MSADGELYIGGDCSETFTYDLDKAFGEGNWQLDAGSYSDWWDMRTFPIIAEVDVFDRETDKIIGKVKILSNAIVEEGMGGRHIELEPEDIEITQIHNNEEIIFKEFDSNKKDSDDEWFDNTFGKDYEKQDLLDAICIIVQKLKDKYD